MMKKAVCVTGANRGLGFAFVQRLLEADYAVFAGEYDKAESGLGSLKESYGEQLQIVELDIADDESVKRAAGRIAEQTGRLEFIFNNAGMLGDTEATALDELDFSEMQQLFNVNALGALRVSHHLLPLLLNGERKLVVNISSEAGSIATCWRSGWYGYCMSKAALNMQSAILHNHLQTLGGQVLVIHPGWMKTHMKGKLDDGATYTPEEGAAHILDVVFHYQPKKTEHPDFLDLMGGRMEW